MVGCVGGDKGMVGGGVDDKLYIDWGMKLLNISLCRRLRHPGQTP